MGVLGIRSRTDVADEGDMINVITYLIGITTCAAVAAYTDNAWLVGACAFYGMAMNILGFADGLKRARK